MKLECPYCKEVQYPYYAPKQGVWKGQNCIKCGKKFTSAKSK